MASFAMTSARRPLLSLLLLPLLLAGCGQSAPPAAVAASPFLTSTSLQDLMVSVVDPAADALWDSVSTEATKAGIVEHQPSSDADWQALRRQAVTLVEASNLLVVEGRPVVAAGKKVEDAHVAGVLTAAETQQAIAADRPRFIKLAHGLHDAAKLALEAVDGRDAGKVLAAGSAIQVACENCHVVYWYPNARKPPVESAAAPATTPAATAPVTAPASAATAR